MGRKKLGSRKKVPLALRVDKTLRRKIRDRAKKEKIPVTQLCEEAFREYLWNRAAY